jgi:hypothetical protein
LIYLAAVPGATFVGLRGCSSPNTVYCCDEFVDVLCVNSSGPFSVRYASGCPPLRCNDAVALEPSPSALRRPEWLAHTTDAVT